RLAHVRGLNELSISDDRQRGENSHDGNADHQFAERETSRPPRRHGRGPLQRLCHGELPRRRIAEQRVSPAFCEYPTAVAKRANVSRSTIFVTPSRREVTFFGPLHRLRT